MSAITEAPNRVALPLMAYYGAHLYQVDEVRGNDVLIRWPGAVAQGWTNTTGSYTAPLLMPSWVWVKRHQVDLLPQEYGPVLPAPADGLQVGGRCRWGSSLAEWVITAIDGGMTTIHQLSGYAAAVPFSAPLSELRVT